MMSLAEIIDGYVAYYPEDRDGLRLLISQVDDDDVMTDRRNFRGHITGAAIVLSPELDKVLLVHHRIFDRWLQPGGHWEADEADPMQAARREAVEETGVRIGRYVPLDTARQLIPLHVDTHFIPANPRKDEAQHYHHDFRYVFVAADQTLRPDTLETRGADWFTFDSPEASAIALAIRRLRERGMDLPTDRG